MPTCLALKTVFRTNCRNSHAVLCYARRCFVTCNSRSHSYFILHLLCLDSRQTKYLQGTVYTVGNGIWSGPTAVVGIVIYHVLEHTRRKRMEIDFPLDLLSALLYPVIHNMNQVLRISKNLSLYGRNC